MASITGSTSEKVYSIPRWLGLNENPDGDTRLKMGEASEMVNWKITRDGNLKRRPGQEFFAGLNSAYVVSVSPNVVKIAENVPGTDVIYAYGDASAMAPPGTISFVGAGGVVERGKFRITAATVEDGVLSGDGPVGETGTTLSFTAQNGVLSAVGGSDRTTIAQLATATAELGEGEFIYIEYDEAKYALRNDSITRNGNNYDLNGYTVSAVVDGGTAQPITGLWSGVAGGKQVLLAACDNTIWSLYDAETDTVTRTALAVTGGGEIDTSKGVNFIPFDNKVYIQNGIEYYVWNGTTLSTVTGYIPLIAISIGPDGSADAGELTGEYVNLLINKRRVWLSPNGDAQKTFTLPENAKSVTAKYLDGSTAPTYSFTANTNQITFTSTLTAAVNSIEVEYTVKTHSDDNTIPDYRSQVTAMRFCELYSGGTDQALFFYGDGTNKTIYTGMDYDGMPRADYFPDQYEASVGDANTPITSMARHYSVLVCFKTDSAWALTYGTTELATGDVTTAVYVTPVNRDKGNDAPGQVRLVDNNLVTCSGSELYQWINSSYYSSNLTRDERQARRISDRVQKSIKDFDFKNCCMWDDNDGQEFYISGNGKTLVWNYVQDAWYRYDGINTVIMCNFRGDVIVGTPDGKVLRLTYEKDTDDGIPIKATWKSGAMDFGASNMRKYSSMVWIGMKPVAGTSVDICVITDRKNTFKEKIANADKAKVKGEPFTVRSKIKAKKFVFYKLILSVDHKMPAVTVTNVDFRVRQTGYSK